MSSRDVDVVVYVEHAVRELDVACILRHVMRERHGMRLEICPLRFREYANLTKWNPKAVAVSGFFNEDAGTRRWRYYWPNAVFCNLAYEQVFQNINSPFKRPRTEFGLRRLQYSAWGQFFVDYLVGHGVPLEHIHINGNPTYSLYRDPYRQRFEGREEMAKQLGLDPAKRWVFFPENYHAAFFGPKRIAEYVTLGVPEEEALAFREFGNQSLTRFCEWLRDIPADTEVILRPRPATPMERFMEKALPALGGSVPKNLHITKESTVREWVLNADAVGSSYSTTLIEAAVARKPLYMIQTVPFPELVMNDWYDKVDHICTEEEFRTLLTGETEKGDPTRLGDWAEETMMAGGDPILNIADWLASMRNQFESQPKYEPEWKVQARHMTGLFRRYNRQIRNRITKKTDGGHSHDYFTDDDIERLTREWGSLIGKHGSK